MNAVHVTAIDWAGVIPITQQNAERFGLSDRVGVLRGTYSPLILVRAVTSPL